MFELTQEQKDAIDKIVRAFQAVVEAVKTLWKRLKEVWSIARANFDIYAMSLQPRKRYKFLKAIGIKNYIPFFRREGVIHCRNNC